MYSATRALGGFGDSAKQALPALAELLTNGNPQIVLYAATTLAIIGDPGKQAIPVIVELLTYSAPSQQAEAVVNGVRSGAASALERMGSEATAAVPSLIQLLADSDKVVRGRSAIALWKIAGRTDGAEVMAANIWPPGIFSSGSSVDLEDQLNALAEMGPAAKAAVPSLHKLCRFNDQVTGPRAFATLKKIDPEAAATVRPLPGWESPSWLPPPAVP